MLIANFNKDIKSNGKTFHLRFYGFNGAAVGARFLIAAHDNDEHFVFHMRLEKGEWVIINEAPRWVHKIQSKLSDIINGELKK